MPVRRDEGRGRERLKELEKRNARLKKLVAEQALDIDMLKELSRRNLSAPTPTPGRDLLVRIFAVNPDGLALRLEYARKQRQNSTYVRRTLMTALFVLFAILGMAIVALGIWLGLDARKRGRISGTVQSPEELYRARAADTEQHRARFGGGGLNQQNWPR